MADDEYDFDPWELGSGLPDKIVVRVDNPQFKFDAQLQDGTRLAFFLDGTVLSGMDDVGGEFSQWYTVGAGWEPASKGQRLVREDGRTGKINKSSNYGRLVASLLRAAEEQGLTDVLRKRGNPFDAKLWDGLELLLEREEYTYTDMQTKERRDGSRLNVSRIEKIAGATGAQADGAGPVATDTGLLHGPGDLQPKLKVQLTNLARTIKASGGTHSQFAEAAFSDVDGVLENPVAEDAVMNQNEGSIWASA